MKTIVNSKEVKPLCQQLTWYKAELFLKTKAYIVCPDLNIYYIYNLFYIIV